MNRTLKNLILIGVTATSAFLGYKLAEYNDTYDLQLSSLKNDNAEAEMKCIVARAESPDRYSCNELMSVNSRAEYNVMIPIDLLNPISSIAMKRASQKFLDDLAQD